MIRAEREGQVAGEVLSQAESKAAELPCFTRGGFEYVKFWRGGGLAPQLFSLEEEDSSFSYSVKSPLISEQVSIAKNYLEDNVSVFQLMCGRSITKRIFETRILDTIRMYHMMSGFSGSNESESVIVLYDGRKETHKVVANSLKYRIAVSLWDFILSKDHSNLSLVDMSKTLALD
jgi:hypothetical protein